MKLFFLECKRIGKNVTWWLFVAAITVVFLMNYGNVDREEISNASDTSSVFYNARDGLYASGQNIMADKNKQNQMMLALTRKLLHCYRNNSYEYYPFDYIKEKSFSKSEQAKVSGYLQEITGMDEAALLKETGDVAPKEPEKTDIPTEESDSDNSSNSFEIDISGKGAYVAEPGTGNMNEAGQYEFQPGDWEYVENSSDILNNADGKEDISSDKLSDSKERDGNFSIQVSFQRFMEIMDEISGMIGKNSYFSRALIDLYYGDNDMENAPVTLKQHEEFYDGDKITGAFARYYCDGIALAVMFLPVFVIAAITIGDKRHKTKESIYTKPVSGFKLIFTRYLAAILMMLIPILLLPVRSFFVLAGYANKAGYATDIFAFPKYIIGWILPTLLLVSALTLFLTVLTDSPVSVLAMGVFLLLLKPSVGKIAGGNYELFDIAIRHNTLKGFGRMMQNLDMLIINRMFITGVSFLFVLLSVGMYHIERRGGLSFHVREFVRYHKTKL